MPFPKQSPHTVALIGNPNTGKSTLFSALVGVHQHVGNYPGVTVEKRIGRMEHEGCSYDVVDLPGLYSLAPHSRDEMVAVDVLLGRRDELAAVDVIVCIVDAANLERNMYLVSQVLELGLPTVLALTMLDVAEDHGVSPDVKLLGERLPIPVVATRPNHREGIGELKAAIARAGECAAVVNTPESDFPEPFRQEVASLESVLADHLRAESGDLSAARGFDRARRVVADHLHAESGDRRPAHWLAGRLLLDVDGYLETRFVPEADGPLGRELHAARRRLAEAGCELPGVETTVRYDWIGRVLDGVLGRPDLHRTTASDRIDRVLTHRFWGTTILLLVMIVIFQSVFTWAGPLMELVDGTFGAIGGWVEAHTARGALQSLLVDGVIGGVGGVMIFLPQILILFFFIAILVDCGYMARAAFLMDKLMVRVGLSGKSFIPMLSSFACAVPGIMAARVISDERHRLTTILVAPLMTCSARLPIYTLLIAAFIPQRTYAAGLLNLQGLVLVSLYLLGIVTAVVVALVLKRTILRGGSQPFVMELPSYKWPTPRTVFHRVSQRGWVFLKTAGTMILAVSILVWAALYYPHDAELVEAPFRPQQQQLRAQFDQLGPDDPGRTAIDEQLADLDRQIQGAYQRQSFLGRSGRLIEPVVKPLGWDWRIGCAVIASFPAREVVVATLGVIYNLGEDVDEESRELRAMLRNATWDGTDRKVFTVPVALSMMVFFALCAQCAASLAVIKRETNSWRWPVFTFVYMTVLAYVGALATYHAGTWIGGG